MLEMELEEVEEFIVLSGRRGWGKVLVMVYCHGGQCYCKTGVVFLSLLSSLPCVFCPSNVHIPCSFHPDLKQ